MLHYDLGVQFAADRLRECLLHKRVTMLGVGPMSRTSTLAAIRLANQYKAPIALIPSRRQVDAASFGGGYVENWSTEVFAQFVRSHDVGGYALLSRDHSGPWQSQPDPTQAGGSLSLPNAMEEAKVSLSDDIESGFDLLHIDPSPALSRGFSEDDVDDIAVELIEHCVGSMPRGDHCAFEVGTDEQDLAPDSLIATRVRMDRITRKLRERGLPQPLFYVAQTGTKVAETRNVGSFDQPLTVRGSLPSTVQLPAILDLCKAHGLFLKEHNADYLSDNALLWHRKFGIHAANVAPEFGVVETKALLEALWKLGLETERQRFCDLVLTGRKWTKWLVPDSRATDLERVTIAGHYHFSNPEVIELRSKAAACAERVGYSLEDRIYSQVEGAIDRYLRYFGYGSSRA